MDKENWKKIEDIYDQAVLLDLDKQESFVKQQADKNLETYQQVMKMLNTETQGFMQAFPEDIAGLNEFESSEPTQLGHFEIIKKIATGGMGRVYLAQSSMADVPIKVALKTIRIELINDELKRRFQNEKNILSKLQHKNIASLIDAGVTENNIPYIATEWVDGKNIKDYCIQNKLNIKQRLKLFLQICSAMTFAHNKLIIHRDLKPDNILVNDQKQVKLLDFGIAKIVDENQRSQTQTQIFTPDYAAPEQLSGDMCTAATDVYSLGVVLFEMLTNTKRFELTGLSLTDKIKAVNSPTNPNIKTIKVDKTLPYSLAGISGTLEIIINKAMHIDPNRRYQSVYALVGDVESFLDQRPIKAMKDTVLYKTKMLLLRNKLASSFLALAFISLLVGWYISNQQFRLKELEADKSEVMLDFLNKLLVSGSPIQGGSTNITVKQMFETGINKYDFNSIRNPYIKAELAAQIGLIYGQIGDMKKELEYANISVDYYKNKLTNSKNANSFIMHSGQIGGAYVGNHDYETALDYIQSALFKVKQFEIDPLLLSKMYIYLARTYAGKRNTAESKHYIEKAQILVNQNSDFMSKGEVSFYQYALYFDELADEEALAYLKEAQLNFEKTLGGKYNPNLQHAISARADLLSIMGRYKESETLHLKARELTIETFGRDDFLGLISRAKNLNKLGKFDISLNLLKEAEQVYVDYKLSREPAYHGYLSYLATVYVELGMFNEAEKHYKIVLDFFTKILPENHVILKSINNSLLDLYLKSEENLKRDALVINLKSYLATNKIEQNLPNDVEIALHINLANSSLQDKNYLIAGEYYLKANKLITNIEKYNEGWLYWQLQTGLEFTKIKQGNLEGLERFRAAKNQLLGKVSEDKWYDDFYSLD